MKNLLFFLVSLLSCISLFAMNKLMDEKEESELNELMQDALKDYEKDEQQAINEFKNLLEEPDLLDDNELFVQRVKNLVRRGASINTQAAFGETALMIASGNSNVQTVKEFLRMGANPYIADAHGWTAIFYAIEQDLPENVKLLINQGVAVDRHYGNGETALIHAVTKVKPKIVKLLLDLGANKNVKNRQGESALDIATQNKNQPIIDLLKIERWSE